LLGDVFEARDLFTTFVVKIETDEVDIIEGLAIEDVANARITMPTRTYFGNR